MGLEIIRGRSEGTQVKILVQCLQSMEIEGTLYVGYPIISSSDDTFFVEALLISKENGLIVFDFPNTNEGLNKIKDNQDSMYFMLEAFFKKHEALRDGRDLAFRPCVISFFPSRENTPEQEPNYFFANPDSISEVIYCCEELDDSYFKALAASIQRVTTIKPRKKRDNVKKTDSKGAKLKRIEKEIANLDQWQKKAAIEVVEGVQRIRGLAGSGKTVVLALKAAYLHTQHPDWIIVITYHTRSLKQQLEDLIERFTFEHAGDKPNWEKLLVLPSWGSKSDPGVYSIICEKLQIAPVNFAQAKAQYGMEKAFEGICDEVLTYLGSSNSKNELFDAVLIDEAQDLPSSFFKLIYETTKYPKRIVFAYDELQSINTISSLSVKDLFGEDEDGNPLVSIQNVENEPQRDIILPVCYRNTHWSLTIAHALGFGVYREGSLVQMFDELHLWNDIGYSVEQGSLEWGNNIVLRRRNDSYPDFFERELNPGDAVLVPDTFSDEISQYEWVSKQIQKNIQEEELDPDDILVVFPSAIHAQKQFQKFSKSMQRRDLDTHLAGVSTGRDIFSIRSSVTCAHIYRAKGNESPMVYILNAGWCSIGYELIKLRNILFTAITRSRAWVRICGVGEEMDILQREISNVIDNNYTLNFRLPTLTELKEIRTIHRERTDEEKDRIKSGEKHLKELSALLDEGLLSPEQSLELKRLLAKLEHLS
ncbi:DEAD/DEAH box helicase [Oceanidesulfovibrio marinus]|uniref:DNA 3'-5' helicase II n=1 Tax=Oceanidesulfovibrio marinus TaxID=370038 RepID=A0A6P1ZBW9_9BACT|nr:ATP-binding domain-containing protein [Oceanidesulfovibrio marinus]TVM30217.1 RNA helicase [Oceanidesulfovibrio marinus]